MALLTKSDLQFKDYSWTVYKDDDPEVTGKPDSTLLNRMEGYEVLPFINRLADEWNFKQKESGLKIERMIRQRKGIQGDNSHKTVKEWIREEWKNPQYD